MLIYWLLLLIPGALYVLLMPLRESTRNRIVTAAFFLILGTMLALRSADCGIDMRNYEYYFRNFSYMPWRMLRAYDLEQGYAHYVKLITSFTDNFQVFVAITSILCVGPLLYLYQRFPRGAYLRILLFVNMSLFPMLFSGLRQSMAIGIGIFAYLAVVDGKNLRFLLLTGLACLFHESAYMLLLLYPACHIRIRQKHTAVIVIVLCVLLVFNREIFLLMGRIAELLGSSYNISATNTGAFMMIVLLFLFFLFSMLFLDEEKAGREVLCIRGIVLLALIIQIFAPLNYTVSRMGYYFLAYIPILVPEVVYQEKREFSQITLLAHFVMCAFFFVYFLYTAYTGADILRIYPYVPFWEGA